MTIQSLITELEADLEDALLYVGELDSDATVTALQAALAAAIADAEGLAPTTLRLQLGSLTLDLNDPDTTGFIISEIDLGYAAPRVVADDLPGQDGQFDQTAYFSTRTIQLTGALVPTLDGTMSRSAVMDQLAPFLAPSARPTLVYALDSDMSKRCLDLRVGQWTNPIDHPVNATAFSVQWVCPNPVAYSQTTNEVDIAFVTESMAGRSYPRTYPLTYPAGVLSGFGDAEIVSSGTYAAWPTMRVFGPCSDPAVYWINPISFDDLNIQIVFSGLIIGDGDYVEIDAQARTALLNGLIASSVYNFIDFANTTWGPLQPGLNLLRFSPGTGGADCICEVFWRDSYLS